MAPGNVVLGTAAAEHTQPDTETQQESAPQRIVNDFNIQVATVNGSGSQSANSILLKSIFGNGYPG